MQSTTRHTLLPLAAALLCVGCGSDLSLDVEYDVGVAPAAVVEGPGDLELGSIFTDNMVLQRGMPAPVWGTDRPGQVVSVTVAGATADAVAGDDGRWSSRVGPVGAGGPYELVVTGSGTVTVANVLVGEVWICSGQSNMQWSVGGSNDAEKEIASSDNEQIRLLSVNTPWSLTPLDDVKTTWQVCGPESVRGFSGVGYFFGRAVQRDLGVPVGLIGNAWGGTPAEAWTSVEALAAEPTLAHYVKTLREKAELLDQSKAELEEKTKRWAEAAARHRENNIGEKAGWAGATHPVDDWEDMDLPQMWEKAGLDIDGAVWFRRTVAVPQAWAGKALTLELGAIDDFDSTYFNGTLVGSIGPDQPNYWSAPRVYTVPAELVAAGDAVIAVRAFDHWLGGGFGGTEQQMKVAPADGSATAKSLAGPWRYKVEYVFTKDEMRPSSRVNGQNLPGTLYYGRLGPIMPYGIRGAIWYQGESNAGRAYEYRTLFRTMIRDWRAKWGQGDFPFGFVQLANFMAAKNQPGASAWAELREAQLMALAEPNTGMAVTIDVGAADDIHPRNKQDVGGRLARWALADAYGRGIVYSGPVYRSMSVDGSRVRLRFDHVGSGLTAPDGELKRFSVAGPDRVFRWAEARIEGDEVVVWCDDVSRPVAVRYAWSDNPDGFCLFNREGLPATPFRTDEWPGVTQPKKR